MQSSFQRRGRRFQKKAAADVGAPDRGAGADAAAAAAAHAASRGPTHPSPSPLDAVAPRVDVPATHVAGTRPGLHGHTLVSSGLADLDNLLGGGVPLGTVVVLGTDGDPASAGGNACTLLRYFVAEGCASGHAGMWIHPGGGGARAGSGGSRSVARTLPRVVVDKARAEDDDDDDGSARRDANGDANGDGLRIAWQYRRYLRQGKALDDGRVGGARDGLGAGLSTSGGGGSSPSRRRNDGGVRRLPEICHRFDLTRESDPAVVDAADLTCVAFRTLPALGDQTLKLKADVDGDYARAYERCRAFVDELRLRRDGSNAVGRIAIHPGVNTSIDVSAARSTVRFLRALRGLLRGTRVCAVCVVSTKQGGPDTAVSLAAMTHVADARVDVESLPGAPCAMEQTLPDPLLCVGLVRVVKIAFPGVAGASPLTRMDRTYALQLRRRRMALAPLQLSPEDHRHGGGPGASGSGGAGGVRTSNLGAGGRRIEAGSTGKKSGKSGGLCGSGPAGDPRNDPLDF